MNQEENTSTFCPFQFLLKGLFLPFLIMLMNFINVLSMNIAHVE